MALVMARAALYWILCCLVSHKNMWPWSTWGPANHLYIVWRECYGSILLNLWITPVSFIAMAFFSLMGLKFSHLEKFLNVFENLHEKQIYCWKRVVDKIVSSFSLKNKLFEPASQVWIKWCFLLMCTFSYFLQIFI